MTRKVAWFCFVVGMLILSYLTTMADPLVGLTWGPIGLAIAWVSAKRLEDPRTGIVGSDAHEAAEFISSIAWVLLVSSALATGLMYLVGLEFTPGLIVFFVVLTMRCIIYSIRERYDRRIIETIQKTHWVEILIVFMTLLGLGISLFAVVQLTIYRFNGGSSDWEIIRYQILCLCGFLFLYAAFSIDLDPERDPPEGMRIEPTYFRAGEE